MRLRLNPNVHAETSDIVEVAILKEAGQLVSVLMILASMLTTAI